MEIEQYKQALRLLKVPEDELDAVDLEQKLTGIGRLILVTNNNFNFWLNAQKTFEAVEELPSRDDLSSWLALLRASKPNADDEDDEGKVKKDKAALSEPIALWSLLSNLYVLSEELGLDVTAAQAWELAPPLKAKSVRRNLAKAIDEGLIASEKIKENKRAWRHFLTPAAKAMVIAQIEVTATNFGRILPRVQEELKIYKNY